MTELTLYTSFEVYFTFWASSCSKTRSRALTYCSLLSSSDNRCRNSEIQSEDTKYPQSPHLLGSLQGREVRKYISHLHFPWNIKKAFFNYRLFHAPFQVPPIEDNLSFLLSSSAHLHTCLYPQTLITGTGFATMRCDYCEQRIEWGTCGPSTSWI